MVLGWPSLGVTHFGSFEMSFHLWRLQQHGGEVALFTEGCGFVDRAAVVSVAGRGREERGLVRRCRCVGGLNPSLLPFCLFPLSFSLSLSLSISFSHPLWGALKKNLFIEV